MGRGKAGKSPPPVAKGKSLYMTPYSIPGLSHPVAMVMTGLLGRATFVIALVSLASGSKMPIVSHETTTGFAKWTYTVLVSFIHWCLSYMCTCNYCVCRLCCEHIVQYVLLAEVWVMVADFVQW